MKKDYTVEYAHIYSNDKISVEHETSLNVLGELKQKLENKSKSFALVVLVDDYSFPDPTFSYDDYIKWLSEKGFRPDIVFRESQLIPVCDEVLKLVNNEKLKNKLVDYIKSKKYPCSLFIAAWYLLRAGYISHDGFAENLVASKLFNILPQSFKPFEDQALEIIRATKHAELVDNIEYEFIDGRLIA